MEYCPTSKMIADFFTKPLQGKLFRKLRDVVLGYKHINSLQHDEEDIVKERVRNNEKTTNVCLVGVSKDSIDNKGTRKVTWADIVSGKGKGQKDESSALILLKQSQP